MTNKNSLLILVRNPKTQGIIACFTQARLSFVDFGQNLPYTDKNAFVANLTNLEKFTFKGNSESVATYVEERWATLHFTGNIQENKSDFAIMVSNIWGSATSFVDRPGYKIPRKDKLNGLTGDERH